MFRSLALSVLTLAIAAPAAAWELAVCSDPAGLPYSARDESGYDNRIAAILADELGADLRFVWMPDNRQRTARGFLHEGACDVIMGVIDGQNGTLTSHAYYRTTYVFVSRDGAVTSLDSPELADMRIGVIGGARRTTPASVGLMRRGYLSQIVHFGASATAGETETAMLDALETGEIDLAILWGPMAAHLERDGLVTSPVAPEIDIPFLPMFAALTVGVRPQDEALRDAIDHALAQRWDDVQAVLTEASVPVLYLPQPQLPEATQ
ncbi:transporter substrate-binding domain-containing protein [Ruegeria marina]|uniref:ABC-type amino acid transport substrate-binding protein n=1 Tax=Ruegeria marina TaxID=639004 RepID=A0A1G6ZPS5_9RHOB|nr:transporter substrate-binding domain-containing protein [Ruegeria marina]SDE03845.1 ABC-type amino acid transport substrate-binding protein [Ruegeria marina]